MNSQLKKGYKLTEVGVIPEDWEVKPLKLLVIFINGKAHENDIREAGQYIVANSKFISSEAKVKKYSNKCHCSTSQGNILMVMSDVPNGRAIAKCFFVDRNNTYTVNQRICSLEVIGDNPRFVFYQLDKNPFYLQFDDGVKQTNLRRDEVLACPLALPPLPEQRSIATVLSDTDALIESLEKAIVKKRNLKQATMQQLLTGKTRLPGFSGEWGKYPFFELASCRKERIDPKIKGIQEFCVELEHIESGTGKLIGHSEANEQASLKGVFYPSDILFGKLRSYLRKYWLANCKGVCSTEIWVLVADPKFIASKFLYQIVSTDEFIEIASSAYGTHMPRADWKVVKEYEIKCPPIEEQKAIATVLSDMDAEIAALEQRRDKTRLLKQGMMQELLTGRIRLIHNS